tara:strand:+ start:3207 stop:3374 length:168 start_codon:yes stop_codon:yes gene_type:complete
MGLFTGWLVVLSSKMKITFYFSKNEDNTQPASNQQGFQNWVISLKKIKFCHFILL